MNECILWCSRGDRAINGKNTTFFSQYSTLPQSGDTKRLLIRILTKFALDYGNKISLRKENLAPKT